MILKFLNDQEKKGKRERREKKVMDFNAELIGSTLQGQLALFLETE